MGMPAPVYAQAPGGAPQLSRTELQLERPMTIANVQRESIRERIGFGSAGGSLAADQ
jgi:hypothetical protein